MRRRAICLFLCSSWASAAHAVISETTRPAPSAAACRRNGASVMPVIGASSTGLGSLIEPMERPCTCHFQSNAFQVTHKLCNDAGARINQLAAGRKLRPDQACRIRSVLAARLSVERVLNCFLVVPAAAPARELRTLRQLHIH